MHCHLWIQTHGKNNTKQRLFLKNFVSASRWFHERPKVQPFPTNYYKCSNICSTIYVVSKINAKMQQVAVSFQRAPKILLLPGIIPGYDMHIIRSLWYVPHLPTQAHYDPHLNSLISPSVFFLLSFITSTTIQYFYAITLHRTYHILIQRTLIF